LRQNKAGIFYAIKTYKMPVRAVSGRGGNMIGRFPSLKMGRMIAFESLIEQDYIYLLDFEPEVLAFSEQPVQIEYHWEGKSLHYTPDFQVIRKMGEEFVECKPKNLVHRDDNQRKFKAAREWCQNKGGHFRVVTDEEIRAGNRLNNIKLLTRHARVCFPPELLQQARQCLNSLLYPKPLINVAKFILPDRPEVGVSILLHLAYHHQIQLGLDHEPISASTMIQISENLG
jgi:hypothetical protein